MMLRTVNKAHLWTLCIHRPTSQDGQVVLGQGVRFFQFQPMVQYRQLMKMSVKHSSRSSLSTLSKALQTKLHQLRFNETDTGVVILTFYIAKRRKDSQFLHCHCTCGWVNTYSMLISFSAQFVLKCLEKMQVFSMTSTNTERPNNVPA